MVLFLSAGLSVPTAAQETGAQTGMVGRMAFERAGLPEEYARGRKDLEAACSRVGGFPCRVLARQLETGKLGPYDPTEIGDLLTRACESGDPDACGQPATAEETFD